jgi:predicted Zn-dependent protease
LDSAAVVLDRLLATYPGDCGALANRVALLVATGKMSEAEQSLQAAVECDSMLPQNYINGYRIYAGLDDLGQAAVMLERVEALAPDNPQVEALKADMEKITGIPADTLTHYLAPYARSESSRVTAAKISILLDSLRHIQH